MKRAYWITSVDITLAHGNTEEVYSTYLADDCNLYEYVSYLRALYPQSVFIKIEHRHRFVHESDNGHGQVNNPFFEEDFDFTWGLVTPQTPNNSFQDVEDTAVYHLMGLAV